MSRAHPRRRGRRRRKTRRHSTTPLAIRRAHEKYCANCVSDKPLTLRQWTTQALAAARERHIIDGKPYTMLERSMKAWLSKDEDATQAQVMAAEDEPTVRGEIL